MGVQMSAPRFYLQTLGCAKNIADSDGIHAVLERAGLKPAERAEEADVLIVNTCGFLQAARRESLDVLRALGRRKQDGQVLIAVGCLISRYGEQVKREAPGVDGVLDAGRWLALPRFIQLLREHNGDHTNWFDEAYLNLPIEQLGARSVTEYLPRRVVGRDKPCTAFLKIADGCDRPCSFCIIPAIKGPHRSKAPEAVIAEARELVAQGVKEIVLVAQDTTAYGWDWGLRDQLAPLLERLCQEVEGLRWLRLMYAYPGHVTPRLIETMARFPQIVHYLDVPLQHAHPAVLHRMRRPNLPTTQKMLEALRAAMPDLALRTTFIVGFPGETEEEFRTLLEFIETQQFDRVGVFEYSREEGTPAATMPNQVSRHVKARRRREAMLLQQRISLHKNRSFVGKVLEVLIEGVSQADEGVTRSNPNGKPESMSIGRSYRDAPEVDGLVIVPTAIPVGTFVKVKITQATTYDLIGQLV